MSIEVAELRKQGGLLLEDRDKGRYSITENTTYLGLTGLWSRKFNFELLDYYMIKYDTRAERIDPAGAVALGLTEICMDMGRGKVCWVKKPDWPSRPMTRTYYELPDLLYVDHGWSAEDVDKWRNLSHVDRLDLLSCGACLSLNDDDKVLAISMRIAREECDFIHLNATSKCHVALFIDREVHLGLYGDLLNGGTLDMGKIRDPSSRHDRPTWWVDKSEKQGCRYHSLFDVMQALRGFLSMCLEPLLGKTVVDATTNAHNQRYQLPIGTTGFEEIGSSNAAPARDTGKT